MIYWLLKSVKKCEKAHAIPWYWTQNARFARFLLKKPQVTIGKDKAIYKLLGDVESRQELESNMPEGFKSVNYNLISGSDWEGHPCVEDEPNGLPASQNDHYKYMVNSWLITLADEHHRQVVWLL